RLKIGIWQKTFRNEALDDECAAGVRNAASRLEEMGHIVEESRPDFDWQLLVDSMMNVLTTALGPMLGMIERMRGSPIGPTDLEPLTHAVLAQARTRDLDFYLTNLMRMQLEVRRMAAFFETYDILVTPTLTTPPP